MGQSSGKSEKNSVQDKRVEAGDQSNPAQAENVGGNEASPARGADSQSKPSGAIDTSQIVRKRDYSAERLQSIEQIGTVNNYYAARETQQRFAYDGDSLPWPLNEFSKYSRSADARTALSYLITLTAIAGCSRDTIERAASFMALRFDAALKQVKQGEVSSPFSMATPISQLIEAMKCKEVAESLPGGGKRTVLKFDPPELQPAAFQTIWRELQLDPIDWRDCYIEWLTVLACATNDDLNDRAAIAFTYLASLGGEPEDFEGLPTEILAQWSAETPSDQSGDPFAAPTVRTLDFAFSALSSLGPTFQKKIRKLILEWTDQGVDNPGKEHCETRLLTVLSLMSGPFGARNAELSFKVMERSLHVPIMRNFPVWWRTIMAYGSWLYADTDNAESLTRNEADARLCLESLKKIASKSDEDPETANAKITFLNLVVSRDADDSRSAGPFLDILSGRERLIDLAADLFHPVLYKSEHDALAFQQLREINTAAKSGPERRTAAEGLIAAILKRTRHDKVRARLPEMWARWDKVKVRDKS